MDERSLIQSLQERGDRGAFEVLVKLYHRVVYQVAFRFMGEHGSTDDVVQETFIKAFNAVGSFRFESSFKSWLVRIAMNTAKNALRARNRRSAVDLEDILEPSVENKDYSRMERMQTTQLLRGTVQRLPEKQRRTLELRIFEDLSFKEIAEIMECPFDTAKANFRHAIGNIKKILMSAGEAQNFEQLKAAFLSMEEDGYENS